MGTYIEPFDFKKVILDMFLGHPSFIAFAAIILISFTSAKAQLSNRNFMLVLMISSLILSAYIGEAIYIIILVLLGFVIFYALSKTIS